MKVIEFSKYLKRLEDTPKRLEMTSILSELLGNLTPEEIDKATYLSLGYLRAPFERVNFNIADKMIIRIISSAYSKTPEEITSLYKNLGDLGDTAYEVAPESSNKSPELTDLYNSLLDIAQTQGTGSQEEKVRKSVALLTVLERISAKYVVRIILGTTRLGFTELTIIDALSNYLDMGKTASKQIEEKYNMHPDIGLIASRIKHAGLKGLEEISMNTGVPVLPQTPQRLTDTKEIIEKMEGTAWSEFKLDGTRVQLHLDKNKKISSQGVLFGEENIFAKTFTRNLEETTHQFPDIIAAAKIQILASSIVLDGEAIGYDKDTGDFLPFQEVIKRKRKHGVKEAAKDIPLKYYVFDILYLNGKSTMTLPLTERRRLLESSIKAGVTIEVNQYRTTQDPEELKNYFLEAKDKGLEGLVIKNPNSLYQAGARSYSWIKMKKAEGELIADDFDCVVLGYYSGKGVRSEFGIGGFLAGIYDRKEDNFKTITKVGTGLGDEDWVELKTRCDRVKVPSKPENYEVDKSLYPDIWTKPQIVVTLKADEITKSPTHTSKFALRFPRFMNYRDDKSPIETTGVSEIKDLHRDQKRGYY